MKINKKDIKYLEDNYGKNILPLSIFDNENFIGINPLEILIYYKKETSIPKLKECLLKTIEHYNLFSSRLIMIDQDKYALQYCRNGAVIKVLPPIDATVDDIDIDVIKKMMVHVKTLPGEPLFAVTGIPINDGVLGALSCSHAICDGISLMLFLYAWNCLIQGRSILPPSKQRLFKGIPVDFDKVDRVFIPPLSELNDNIKSRVNHLSNIKIYTSKEYFSDEFLTEMKHRAKIENDKYKISNNQIMTSILLKKYHEYILPDTETIVLKSPINLRGIHPNVDSMYIGSANFNGFKEFTREEIDKLTINEIAYRIKESITNMRQENYAKEIAHLSEYGIEINMDVFRKNRPPYSVHTNVVSSNLTHLNDIESLFMGPDVGSLLYIGVAVETGFTILKEKNGRIFAQITSRYPLA